MVEEKDVCSSPPVRTPKLQLAAEQPSTGECWISPKKDTPHARAKKKPQQDSRKFVTLYRRQGSKEEKQKAKEKRKEIPIWMQSSKE